jgi:hypothetical protein
MMVIKAEADAVPIGHWYQVTTPSEHNITHRQAIAYWFQVNLFVRRGLHRCNKVGARRSGFFIR